MSMLDGVSQCWWLSETCVVNWNAWAAIGTVAAVFTAVFAPTFQRLLIRKRANALFALAYRADLFSALGTVRRMRRKFPFGMNTAEAHAAEGLLHTDEAFRKNLATEAKELESLASREVDLTKWQGVDIGLAAKVALAIETTKHLHTVYVTMVAVVDQGDETDYSVLAEFVSEVAERHLYHADSFAVRALRPITRQNPAGI